ncbi:MAG: ATP-dependent helicase [Caldilineaceae bacterium]|nr:ATP-dependent helicase [Caldilineaceae bacterium]
MTRSSFSLTAQQQAIVEHATGPALVVAVAGAGKTTAMVHRIARLVRTGVFPARQILATSFNRDASEQIRTALRRWPACKDVHVRTLHSLGYSIIKTAVEEEELPPFTRKGGLDTSGRRTLFAALDLARQSHVAYAPQLARLDYDEFLTYVGACKANLLYADLRGQALPRTARKLARQAKAPPGASWQLDFYRLYERVRIEKQWLTFDDMLLTAWEVLHRRPDLLAAVQRRYRCVLVDEYQDVNLVQAELLDMLVRPHGNFMAIGDDDQTIYTWRGASPDFFLGFAKRYGARTFYMTENFRGRAGQLVLANEVIRHNRRRHPKRLELTRGFGGAVTLTLHGSAQEQAYALASDLAGLRRAGIPFRDMAVLVRVYAQTPPVEEALSAAGIPYRLVGEPPFYQGGDTRKAVEDDRDGVTITTIFRAKGMEWPVVCVPDCNDGLLPLAKAQHPDEERRLFYVALTRAREQLRLYGVQGKPLSPFLLQANYADNLNAVRNMGEALARDPDQWTPGDYVAVGVNAKRLGLTSYIAAYWPASSARRGRVAEAVLAFYALLRARRLQRRLQIGREDVRFWQGIAGAPLRPPPLERPDVENALRQLR